MKKATHIIRIIFTSTELFVLMAILGNFWVFGLTNGRTYTKISKIPPRACALVLGTSPRTRSGNANPYFVARMDAVAQLYHNGKIKKIIASGEKSPNYDEPGAMKGYLVHQEGVPENIIVEDPKGFNTHISILRCRRVYGQNDIIIVSQGFHNLRALFFARNNDMNALGYDAQDVYTSRSFYRNQAREFLARDLAVVYYLLGISPKD